MIASDTELNQGRPALHSLSSESHVNRRSRRSSRQSVCRLFHRVEMMPRPGGDHPDHSHPSSRHKCSANLNCWSLVGGMHGPSLKVQRTAPPADLMPSCTAAHSPPMREECASTDAPTVDIQIPTNSWLAASCIGAGVMRWRWRATGTPRSKINYVEIIRRISACQTTSTGFASRRPCSVRTKHRLAIIDTPVN